MHRNRPPFLWLSVWLSGLSLLTSCGVNYTGKSLYELTSAPARFDDRDAPARLPSAVVVMRCDLDPVVNRETMKGYVERIKAAHPDIRLIVFGESIVSRYVVKEAPEAYQRMVAEPVGGTTMQLMGTLARTHRTFIGYGYTELDADRLYNAFALIDDQGTLVANHRKTYLVPTLDVPNGFTPGTNPTTAWIDGIKVGIQICWELYSVPVTEAYARDPDVKVILYPNAAPGSVPEVVAPFRLRNTWMLISNRIGQEDDLEYPGWYGVYDPAGLARAASTGSEGYLFYDLGVFP